MMLRLVFFSAVFLLFSSSIIAQDDERIVYYGYDAAGNRTSRSLSVVRSQGDDDSGKSNDIVEEGSEKGLSPEDVGDFKAYPNPTYGVVTIEFPAVREERLVVTVTDLMGKQVFRERITSSGYSEIDINAVASGDYVLSIEYSGKQHQWSIVKR